MGTKTNTMDLLVRHSFSLWCYDLNLLKQQGDEYPLVKTGIQLAHEAGKGVSGYFRKMREHSCDLTDDAIRMLSASEGGLIAYSSPANRAISTMENLIEGFQMYCDGRVNIDSLLATKRAKYNFAYKDDEIAELDPEGWQRYLKEKEKDGAFYAHKPDAESDFEVLKRSVQFLEKLDYDLSYVAGGFAAICSHMSNIQYLRAIRLAGGPKANMNQIVKIATTDKWKPQYAQAVIIGPNANETKLFPGLSVEQCVELENKLRNKELTEAALKKNLREMVNQNILNG